jgi:hypothetical protein
MNRGRRPHAATAQNHGGTGDLTDVDGKRARQRGRRGHRAEPWLRPAVAASGERRAEDRERTAHFVEAVLEHLLERREVAAGHTIEIVVAERVEREP